jgi:hypothetical protein
MATKFFTELWSFGFEQHLPINSRHQGPSRPLWVVLPVAKTIPLDAGWFPVSQARRPWRIYNVWGSLLACVASSQILAGLTSKKSLRACVLKQLVNAMNKIETASHASVLLVSLCAFGLLIEKRITIMRAKPDGATQSLVENLGVKGFEWSNSPLNLVIVSSTRCPFCERSLPFYRKLVTERSRLGERFSLVVAAREDSAEVKRFLGDAGVKPDLVVQLGSREPGVRGTPTILLVDSSGVVKKIFEGRLNADEEAEVVAALKVRRQS